MVGSGWVVCCFHLLVGAWFVEGDGSWERMDTGVEEGRARRLSVTPTTLEAVSMGLFVASTYYLRTLFKLD